MSKSDRKRFSRRGFVKTAVTMPVLLPGVGLFDQQAQDKVKSREISPPQSGAEFDFTRQSAALQPDKVVDSACQFCNSLCRLKVQIKSGRIINIIGETADPVQAGSLCVKGPMMMQLVYNHYRVTQPMKRVAGEKGSPDSKFAPVSWDEALTMICQKFLSLRDAGEVRAIANKTSGRLPRGTGSLVNRYFTLLGSPNDTDVGPVCNDAGGNALAWTFGLGNFTNGYGKKAVIKVVVSLINFSYVHLSL